jgi:uncharacterized protein YrrD
MLQSIAHLYGNRLSASDGDIGHVKDVYFDDQSWVVRYVVADTGSWLPGRKVLIAPHAFGTLQQLDKHVRVNLTRKQIEDSPAIETHKPVSRQYEEAYYRYYGWPYYWEGTGLWGLSGFPILELPPQPHATEATAASRELPGLADAHLRSTQAVHGYHAQGRNGRLGYVADFLLDGQSWAIRQLVVKLGHGFSASEVQIPTCQVVRVSYDESTVYVATVGTEVETSAIKPLVSLVTHR